MENKVNTAMVMINEIEKLLTKNFLRYLNEHTPITLSYAKNISKQQNSQYKISVYSYCLL